MLAQQKIDTIRVFNAENQPIYNAIAYNHQKVFIQNADGGFVFSENLSDSVEVFVPKFNSKSFLPQKSIQLQLEQNAQLKPISLVQKNQLDDLINQAILRGFSAKTYERTKIVPTQTNIPNFDLRKSSRLNVFKNSTTVEIEEIDLNGFEKVNQKMLSRELLSYNVFETYFEVFSQQVFSPVGKKRYEAFDFFQVTSKPSFEVIYFKSRQNISNWEGYIVINLKHRSISDLVLLNRGSYNAWVRLQFDKVQKWPVYQSVTITRGQGGQKLSFFGGGLKFGLIQPRLPDSSEYAQLQLLRIFKSQVELPKSKNTRLVDTYYKAKKTALNETTWQNLASLFLSQPPNQPLALNQYIENHNLNGRIRRINAFEQGFLPIEFLDVDLTRLIKVNNYEGFRLGLGLQTNQQFSEWFRLGAYSAYGTKDTSFKYGFSGGVNLNKPTNTWFNLHYENDIKEVGTNAYLTDQRVYSIFEPRLVNITYFYQYEKLGLSLQHNFTPQLLTELRLEKTDIDQTRSYAFRTSDGIFESYNLSTAKLSLRWMPNSKNIALDNRIYLAEENSPSFSAQVEQSFANLLEGDFNFTKISAKATLNQAHVNGHQTEFTLEGNIGFGDIPITHVFHAFPNSPNKENIINRFSVAGVKSFETMYFNEFFNTRQASLHVKHRFNKFKFSNLLQPQLVLISRHAIGGFSEIEQHQLVNFNTLNELYNEAGFEINNILYGFGLSFAYRYGAYHLPVFEDNLSFKFTFYLKL